MKLPSLRRRTKRTAAPPAHFLARWIYPVVLLALGATALVLARAGADGVLHSKGGTVRRAVTDPNAPGFVQQVNPTPTLLVTMLDDKNAPVGVSVMTLGPDDRGGYLVQVPINTVVTVGGTQQTLANAYTSGGIASVERAVTTLLGVGVDDAVEVTTSNLVGTLQPVLPLAFSLRDPIRSLGANGTLSTVFAAGNVSVTNHADVAWIVEYQQPGQSELARTNRQLDFMKAWIGKLAQSADRDAVTPQGDQPFARFVRGLSAGDTTATLLPIGEERADKNGTTYVPDQKATASLVTEMDPLPVPPTGVSWPRVAIYAGSSDLQAKARVAALLVRAKYQVVVVGNAESFDFADNEIAYFDEAHRAEAEKVATMIGGGNVHLSTEEGSVDVSVTLGSSFKG